jgi:hypothetical protein
MAVNVLEGEEMLLTWTSMASGSATTVSLGRTLDLHEVRQAIEARMPVGVHLVVGPQRAG